MKTVQEFMARRRGHVHLMGVCGVGMAGLARLLREAGFRVSGCDLHVNHLADWLRDSGIRVESGHEAVHIRGDMMAVIRSAAVPVAAPEPTRARQLGIPVFSRGEVLPAILGLYPESVAVCGTHGKTTTSTFVAQILRAAGLKPAWCIGGEFRPGAGPGDAEAVAMGVAGGDRGGPLVVEADESDGSLALYRPDVAVVTNVELDHMEHFGSVRALETCFQTMLRATRRRVIYCVDDPRARRLCRGLRTSLGYGFRATATLRAADIRRERAGQSFRVRREGHDLGRVWIPVPGRHNVLNALAATAVAMELGVPFAAIREALGGIGLPLRRFEHVVDRDDLVVVSDYGHHPTEIRSVVGMMRGRGRRLAVFQPHRYTRTLALGAEFPGAFRGVDELVLAPVYAASEMPLRGGSAWDLYGHFRKAARSSGCGPVRVAGSLEGAWAYLRRQLRRGDSLLVIGAGDVEKIAGWARDELGVAGSFPEAVRVPGSVSRHVRYDEPMAKRTTWRVGGCAEIWAQPESAAELTRLVRWAGHAALPWQVVGGGSNLLVSDLGVPGVTIRLGGAEFGGIRIEKKRDGFRVVAGAAVPLPRLVNWLGAHGLGGLEFLEGIPGTVGGAVMMNAGAWGDEMGRHVAWVKVMGPDGLPGRRRAHELAFHYRHTCGLEGGVVLAVALKVAPVDPVRSRAQRAKWATRRGWMCGLQSAGSVFKNPAGDFAGRLIEAAGLKGERIGGARVSRRHANVIVTGRGATASDVRALLERVRDRVRDRAGIWLETEVAIWE